MKTLLLITLLIAPRLCLASDEVPPLPIEIIGTSASATQMVYALKEKIRASRSFKLVIGNARARIQIDVSAVAEDAGNNSYAVSFVWVYCQPGQTNGFFLTNSAATVGIARWNSMADMILSETDEYSKNVKTVWAGAKELLEK